MLTVKETAAVFKVSQQTVYNWIKRGKLRAIKVDNTVRIAEEEIERMKRGDAG